MSGSKLVLLIIMGIILLAVVAVIAYGVFMIVQGSRESKEYRTTSMPGVMSRKTNTEEDADSIASVDLDKMNKEKAAAQEARVQTQSNLNNPNIVMPGPSIPQPQARHAAKPIPSHREPSNHDPAKDVLTNAHGPFSEDLDPLANGIESTSINITEEVGGTIPVVTPVMPGPRAHATVPSPNGSEGAAQNMMNALDELSFDDVMVGGQGSTEGIPGNPFRAPR